MISAFLRRQTIPLTIKPSLLITNDEHQAVNQKSFGQTIFNSSFHLKSNYAGLG